VNSFKKSSGTSPIRPVALLGNYQLRFPGHLLFLFLTRLVVFGSDKQADDICVLLNRPGLSKVAQARLSASAHLWLRLSWATTMIGMFNSLARALMPAEISEISSWRLSCERRLLPLRSCR
jgi:hypothetical protein